MSKSTFSKPKRNYLCTLHFDQERNPASFIPDWNKCRWIKNVQFQLERGEKTNKLHWQILIELKEAHYFCDLVELFPGLMTDLSWVPNKHPNAARNYVHKKETRVGETRYCWRDGSYTTVCRHQRGMACTSVAGGPESLPCVEIGPPFIDSVALPDQVRLKGLLQNKMREMKIWQAYLDDELCIVKKV